MYALAEIGRFPQDHIQVAQGLARFSSLCCDYYDAAGIKLIVRLVVINNCWGWLHCPGRRDVASTWQLQLLSSQ